MNKNSKDIRKKYGEEIVNYRINHNPKISQTKLCEILNSHINKMSSLYLLGQKKLSRIENGDLSVYIPPETVKMLNKICNIPDEVSGPFTDLMQGKLLKLKNTNSIQVKEHGEILTHPSNEEIDAYLGKYYCCFYSTDSATPKLVNGEIELSVDERDENNCLAKLTIFENSKPIKKYNGQFFINRHYRTSYCILIGDKYQEVSLLISSHFNATLEKNLLNIALVLTTSAGSQKRPTMHRMIISRLKPDMQMLDLLTGQLKLNTDELFISKKNLKNMEESLINNSSLNKKQSEQVLKCIEYIQKYGHKETYYRIPESIFYDSDIVINDSDLRSIIVSYIRSRTDIPYYNKTSDTVRDICIDIIRNK